MGILLWRGHHRCGGILMVATSSGPVYSETRPFRIEISIACGNREGGLVDPGAGRRPQAHLPGVVGRRVPGPGWLPFFPVSAGDAGQ
jgi:hypothetical protein